MENVIQALSSNIPALVVLAAMLLLLIAFGLWFIFPASRLLRELRRSVKQIEALKRDLGSAQLVELEALAKNALKGKALQNAWSEYQKTLHAQRMTDDDGTSHIVCWRATVLAESSFTEQSIVDVRIHSDFFKHAPGIFTGLGILGTFSGLIYGLGQFGVSSEPLKAQQQLQILVSAVGHAFVVSGVAISLAMIVTIIEKMFITFTFNQLSKLRESIDDFFTVGAGEEYLERLVRASENSATQASQIKDAIVSELKTVLQDLAQEHRVVQENQANALPVLLSDAIRESLGQPISDIAGAVKNVSLDQGKAVNSLLEDVLSSFAAKMDGIFGGQMSGMSDLLNKTSVAMQASAQEFSALADRMGSTSNDIVESMGSRLTQVLGSIEERQKSMNGQMHSFVEGLKANVSASNTEAADQTKQLLQSVSDEVSSILEKVQARSESSANAQAVRQTDFERVSGAMLGSLTVKVDEVTTQSLQTNNSMREAITQLSTTTSTAISGLNSSARGLQLAMSDLGNASKDVTSSMRTASDVMQKIESSANLLSSSMESVRSFVGTFKETRDSFGEMLSDLRSTIDNAKREASLTSEIVLKIENAAKQLNLAQQQSEDYLRTITDVLIKAHEVFNSQIHQTLRDANRNFTRELTSAVELVSGAVKELEDNIDKAGNRR